MTKETALRQAQEEATKYSTPIVVTFNPYAETEDESDKFDYFPEKALRLFPHEEVIATVLPES